MSACFNSLMVWFIVCKKCSMLLRFVGGRIKMFEKLPIRNSVKDLHKLVEGMGM